jgi:hypothetical protein
LSRLALPSALALGVLGGSAAVAADLPRGPGEIRDVQLLAQARLTLPAVAPLTTPRGAWAFELSGLWASSFSWTQDEPGETPGDRRFLVDGEALRLDATLRRGLGRDVDVGLRVVVLDRSGGTLDGLIDWSHDVANAPDGDRPLFRRNAFRVEGVTTGKEPFSWSERQGAGIGNLELEARWRALDGAGSSASAALVGRVSLPTGTGPFEGNGLAGGGQLVVEAPLGRAWNVFGGLGATVQDPGPVNGVAYEPLRGHAFLALEWRPWRRLSLVAETDAASRLVENIDSYPGLHWVLNVVGRVDLGAGARLDLGFTENLMSQQATTDFAFYLAFGVRP